MSLPLLSAGDLQFRRIRGTIPHNIPVCGCTAGGKCGKGCRRMAVLRMASPEDAAVMREIYAPYITETSVTFETEVPSVEEMAARMRSVLAVYPWIAAEENGEVVGYAYAHRAGERAAYGWNAELSVYVRQDRRRAGLGRQPARRCSRFCV